EIINMQKPARKYIPDLIHQISGLSPVDTLTRLSADFPNAVVFSTSFGLEDQVITDMILGHALSIDVFTLDTGRLFPETYTVWSATLEKYGAAIQPFYPDNTHLEEWVGLHGPNGFYHSVENR